MPALMRTVAATILLVSVSAPAAIMIESDVPASTEGIGSYTGSLDYTPINASSGTLTVSLTNTVAPIDEGLITAFAFNNPGGITGVTLSTLTNLDTLLGGPGFSNLVSTSPFGPFDIGASLSSSWLGGGSPNPGIGPGQTGSWTFNLTGSGLDTLTTDSFVNTLAAGEFFVVRFRGFANDGSDKVPGNVVPEASTFTMMGLALAVAGACSLRRRARQQ